MSQKFLQEYWVKPSLVELMTSDSIVRSTANTLAPRNHQYYPFADLSRGFRVRVSNHGNLSQKFLKIVTHRRVRSLKYRYVTFCIYYKARFCATFWGRERPFRRVWSSRVASLFFSFRDTMSQKFLELL